MPSYVLAISRLIQHQVFYYRWLLRPTMEGIIAGRWTTRHYQHAQRRTRRTGESYRGLLCVPSLCSGRTICGRGTGHWPPALGAKWLDWRFWGLLLCSHQNTLLRVIRKGQWVCQRDTKKEPHGAPLPELDLAASQISAASSFDGRSSKP